MRSLFMRAASTVLVQVALLGAAGASQLPEPLADQLASLARSNPACDEGVLAGLVNRARSAIEEEVGRFEASLPFPASVGQLSCLTNLFNTNLDFAITVPSLDAVFAAAVSNAEERLCSYAREQWQKVTAPLNQSFQLPDFDLGGIVHVPGPGAGTSTTPLAGTPSASGSAAPADGGTITIDEGWKSIYGGN